MHWLKLSVLALAICLCIGAARAEQQDDNICYTTHAGHCVEDLEWQIGWYWANYPPSPQSCAEYHKLYTMGDFWGMCNGIDYDTGDNDGSQSDGDYDVSRTNQWHKLPEDESEACPWQGLDPWIDYDEGTFICVTDF